MQNDWYYERSMHFDRFKSNLHEMYRRINDYEDIPADTSERLAEIKDMHSSFQAKCQKFAEELATINDEILKITEAEHRLSLSRDASELEQEISRNRQDLAETGKDIIHTEEQIKILNERYTVDRKRYIQKKIKYREHLLKGLVANKIPEDHIYSDDRVVIYVDSMKVRKDSVLLVLKAYLITYSRSGFAFLTHPESRIFVYNTLGESMGSPIDAMLVKHREFKGVTITLKYQDDVSLGQGSVKLVLAKSVLGNVNEVTLIMSYNLREITPPTLPEPTTKDLIARTERDFVEKIETIACKKEGTHLLVPVSLDIHGTSVETVMILDTGASVTIVPIKLYLKGNPKPLSMLRKEKFETARGVVQCYIDEVQVSTSAYSRKSIIAISDYDISLLGANYFEDNVFTVDVENECIYVHPRPI